MIGEKSIKKIFSEICDGELTNLEIDDFIKKSIEGYELPKLKRLIIEYEKFIIQEKPEYLIFFKYLFGDRAKFSNDVKVPDEEALSQVIEDYKTKYRNSPETIHSYCEKESDVTMPSDFSPVLNEVADDSHDSSTVMENYLNFITVLTPSIATSMFVKSAVSIISFKFTGPILLAYMIGGKRVSKSIKKLTDKILSDDTNSDFASELRMFMNSPAHHFYVKLHTLYNYLYKVKSRKNSSHVSQPSTIYDTSEISPEEVTENTESESEYGRHKKNIDWIQETFKNQRRLYRSQNKTTIVTAKLYKKKFGYSINESTINRYCRGYRN